MKTILFCAASFFLFSACSGEQKPGAQEQQAVEQQVMKDQEAMDSLESVIKAQIDSVSDDSLMNTEH